MKRYYHALVQWLVSHDEIWEVLRKTILRTAVSLNNSREVVLIDRKLKPELSSALATISPESKVMTGPFTGMYYPTLGSVGSALFPKLLGSYERELHELIERICRTPYTHIVDVGCAEGFYAVGLAMRMPQAHVLAYDIDSTARSLCEKLAKANDVSDRVNVRGECSIKELISIPFSSRSLIISDCEGYEKDLLTPEVVRQLSDHDFLIEVHDFVDIEISSILRKNFEATHDIEVIDSVDDIQKPNQQRYDYPQMASFNKESRRLLLGEYRPCIMQWFFMTSKSGPSLNRNES